MKGLLRTLAAIATLVGLALEGFAAVVPGEPAADFSCSFDGIDTPTGWITSWGGGAPTSWVETVCGKGFKVASGVRPWTGASTSWPNSMSYSLLFYGKLPKVEDTSKLAVWGVGSGNDYGVILLEQTKNGPQLEYLKDASTQVTLVEGTAALDDRYHLVIATVSVESGTTTFALYVDGKQIGSSVSKASSEGSCPATGFQVGDVFGSRPSAISIGVDVVVDELRGYNRALSPSEIATLAKCFSSVKAISVNFLHNSDRESLGADEVAGAVRVGNWINVSPTTDSAGTGTPTVETTDITWKDSGGVTLTNELHLYTCSRPGTWEVSSTAQSTADAKMLCGYLDDATKGSDGGLNNHAGFKVTGIPYRQYTVYIYLSTDSGTDWQYAPFQVGADDSAPFYLGNSVVADDTAKWGSLASNAKQVPVVGVNTIVVRGLTDSTLLVQSPIRSGAQDQTGFKARGTIAGFQIVSTEDEPYYTRTLSADADTTWSLEGAWANGSDTVAAPPADGRALVHLAGAATLSTGESGATIVGFYPWGVGRLTLTGAGLTATESIMCVDCDATGLTNASLGALTIASGKCVTVPSLSVLGSTPTVSGDDASSTLALRLASAESSDTLNYQPKNTFVLEQGQLSVGGGKLTNASVIRIAGANARLIGTASDPMNSGYTHAGKLEMSDGATLETRGHTRLPQTVEVSGSNSQILITGTTTTNWRAVSLRTVNLNAGATATFTRSGDKATASDAGYHLWNTEVNTADGAVLTIDAPLMKGCTPDGLTNDTSLTKSGSGELILTAPAVDSTFTLPTCTVSVNEGVLTLKPTAGTTMDFGAATIAVASGAEVAYAGTGSATLPAPISGSGNLKVKSGAMTATGLSAYTGAVTVSNAELNLADATFGETLPTFTLEGTSTLILPAGVEGQVAAIPTGAAVQVVLSDVELSAGYTLQVSAENLARVTLKKRTAEGTLTDITAADGTFSGGVFAPAMTGFTATTAEADGSYSWGNTDNWTKGVPTASAPASIKVTEATTVLLPADAACSTLYLQGPVTVKLSGEAPEDIGALSVLGNASVPVALANAVSSVTVDDGYTLTLDAGAEGATLTQALAVNGAIKKVGAGTLVLGADLAPVGGTTVAEGSLAFGAGRIPCKGDNLDYSSAGNVTVEGGATLDVAGVGEAYLNVVTLKANATYANSSTTALGTNTRQLAGLVLEGDATVAATGDFGILASGHGASTLNLGGHTLTKTGAGKFWLCHTTVSGGGTLKVVGGGFKSVMSDCTINDAIVFDCGTSDQAFDFSGQTVTTTGPVTKRGTGTMTCDAILTGTDQLLTVEEGTLKLTKANTRTDTVQSGTPHDPTTIVNDGATLDLSTDGATLYAAGSFGGNQKGASVIIRGKVITRDWLYGQAFGGLRVNPPTVSIDGGTVEFTTSLATTGALRGFSITENGGTLVARDRVIVTLNTLTENGTTTGEITNAGALKLTGEGSYTIGGDITIPGAVSVSSTIGGTGTFSGALTFASGAKLDVATAALTAGEVTCTGSLPVLNATTESTTILTCRNPGTVAAALTGALSGYYFKANADGTAVVQAQEVSIPTVGDETLAAETKAILQAAAEAKGMTEVATVVGATTREGQEASLSAAEIDNALSVFTGIVAADSDTKTLTVSYNFGISSITPAYNSDGSLAGFSLVVKVADGAGNPAGLATGVTLGLVETNAAETPVAASFGTMLSTGEVSVWCEAGALEGKSFKVRATKSGASAD